MTWYGTCCERLVDRRAGPLPDIFTRSGCRSSAAGGLGLGGAGILNDPFTFYYAVYLPNQQLQSMRSTPMDSINAAMVTRQYYAQNDRRGLYNPISPYAEQNYDPLHPYSRQQGSDRTARPYRFAATHQTWMGRVPHFTTVGRPSTFRGCGKGGDATLMYTLRVTRLGRRAIIRDVVAGAGAAWHGRHGRWHGWYGRRDGYGRHGYGWHGRHDVKSRPLIGLPMSDRTSVNRRGILDVASRPDQLKADT